MNKLNKLMSALLLGAALAASAQAQNLVNNGEFDQLSTNTGGTVPAGDNYVISSAGNGNLGFRLNGWTDNAVYSMVFAPGIADNPNYAPLAYNETRLANWNLRGSKDGQAADASVILPNSSPDGGNYFGSDGNAAPGALTQTVGGLTVGQKYTLSFDWAGAQLGTGAPGTQLTAGWQVSFASTAAGAKPDVNQSVITPTYTGFSPWTETTIQFTASAASEVLSFTPFGTGSPPTALLDSVAIVPTSPVPEPAQWAMLSVGMLAGALRLRRRRQ